MLNEGMGRRIGRDKAQKAQNHKSLCAFCDLEIDGGELLDDCREHFVDTKFELRVCSFARKKGVRFIAFKAWFQMILSQPFLCFRWWQESER